jgi:methyl-accepting chemotaxis protein
MNYRDLLLHNNRSVAEFLDGIESELDNINATLMEQNNFISRQSLFLERIATSLEQLARGTKRRRNEEEDIPPFVHEPVEILEHAADIANVEE